MARAGPFWPPRPVKPKNKKKPSPRSFSNGERV